ncbi:16S rRNA (guanine(527)-N(7))-methyltransferase RsmG [Fodinicola acaciae]|uniref:16S rRNA (guanine(527)-N(7))-methyltransferase RsmG n=1 Tax=Fodinicola acaciae TaxID=2681555 RepID=UPI0013D1CBCA|nr:16S rRNA (guanine(527)-N(7))-methyltransferase RsmG [Fodinicola acaciae]
MGHAPPDEFAAAAHTVFGGRLPLAQELVGWLVGPGIERGLIGPREAERIWPRHVLNCAVVAELLAADSTVIDVGSGAGLPGLVLAVARADLRVTLLEPLERRVTFLIEAVDGLGLDNVRVVRGRAEEQAGKLSADVVTARAVAPLDKLARWCLPLVRPGGELLAMKGSSAEVELETHRAAIQKRGGGETRTVRCGAGVVDEPATVVVVRKNQGAPSGRGNRMTNKGRR